MEVGSPNGPTSIMNLHDDCLYFIFRRLSSGSDCESFGLTCRRWLHIQNSSRRSLQFQCSLNILNISSLSHSSTNINSLHLQRLLSRFSHLQSLSLSGCIDLPDSSLVQLQHQGSKLEALHLDCCFSITDNGLSIVATGCPSLTMISLYRCKVTDLGLETLARSCLALTDVNLSYCSSISDHGISSLSENCRRLRIIKISSCRNVTGVGFKGCSQTLHYLEAESCKLEPEGIGGILSGGGLEYLNLSSLSWCIHGDGLAAIGSGLATKLRILNLRLCRNVRNDSIEAIAKGCPLLEEWNLALCHAVGLLGWGSIGSSCCNLKRLHVNRCRNLCDEGLKALRNGCRRLLILYISGCPRVSSIGMELYKCLRGDVKIKEEEIIT